MNRKERPQATREGIMQAALALAREEGWQAVTMRQVAERIAYRAPVIYEHFASKEALLTALQRDGFERLALAVQAAGAGQDGEARLLHIADACWQFAFREPELYQLMHGASSTAVSMEETLRGASQVGDIVEAELGAWAAKQGVSLDDAHGKVEVLWGLLHGMASVALLDRIGGGLERAHRLMRQTMLDLLQVWAGKAH